MNNEQVMPIVNTIVAAIVTAVITSDQFKAAVAAITHEKINEEDSLIMFDNEAFKEAVERIIEENNEIGSDSKLERRVKDIVADMSFTTEASRY
jgi:hypothetical protein